MADYPWIIKFEKRANYLLVSPEFFWDIIYTFKKHKGVFEVRPIIDWNKGRAVEFLLETLGVGHSEEVLPIYIGDDRTDEDAFKVLRDGSQGFGILVSTVPKESDAFFSLRDTSEVKKFLKSLVRMKEHEAL
ncbi:hypothetical protein Leryth_021360 [Lithospermum erythrorhizon]|nr:hypothetical protein Leryth_021360 [Lithospermum erythrorhizon]